MYKIILLAVAFSFTGITQAQLLTVASGTNLTIQNGTIFYTDGLTLIPSADFSISNNTLNKSATIVHTASQPYISRVYQFTNNSNSYSGSVQINYTKGAELNSIPENLLTLNIYNGSNWASLSATTRDAVNNFVVTNGVNSVLNELTLANQSSPLPLTWLSFTATNHNQTALLQWATTMEQNTRNFTVQHSANGINWASIGMLPAAGNSSTISHYNYIHTNPLSGLNYYRILQTDIDNRSSYSDIRTIKFTTTDEPFIIIGNPVTAILTVQVNTSINLALYNANGKLLMQQLVNAGTKNIDVSRYAKGTYFLKAKNYAQKVVIR